MLNELKTSYDLHHRVRYLTWVALGSVTLFLLWAGGGFPPQAWRLFAQAMKQIPHLWAIREVAVIVPIAIIAALSLMWLLMWGLMAWVSSMLFWPRKRDVRHIAWLESRKLNIHEQMLLLDEDTVQEDIMNIPKLRLPPKAIETEAASRREKQTRQAARPVLVSVGQAQKTHPTTPLPRAWKREQRNIRAIDDVPTIPERPSRASTSVGTMARTKTQLEVGVGWNSGITRRQQPNEDSLVVLQGTCTYNDRLVPFGLFVVADGMGGHDFGQEASHIAIQSMMQTILRDVVVSVSLNDTIIIELLVNGVEQANTAICTRCREWGKNMGTTLTATLIVDTKAYIVNVGDSRTYLYDDKNGLSQITLDHSLVANLVMAGVITPEEVYTHPDRNKVYRSLGSRDGVEVDWFTRDLCKGDSLLLCSDGLWEMVRDSEILRLVGSGQEPTHVCDMLVQAALRGGGADNVSVIVVRVE